MQYLRQHLVRETACALLLYLYEWKPWVGAYVYVKKRGGAPDSQTRGCAFYIRMCVCVCVRVYCVCRYVRRDVEGVGERNGARQFVLMPCSKCVMRWQSSKCDVIWSARPMSILRNPLAQFALHPLTGCQNNNNRTHTQSVVHFLLLNMLVYKERKGGL